MSDDSSDPSDGSSDEFCPSTVIQLPKPQKNCDLLHKAAEIFFRKLRHAHIVIPANALLHYEGTLAASALVLGNHEDDGHFYKRPLHEELEDSEALSESLKETFTWLTKKVKTTLLPHLLACETAIMTKLCRLDGEIRNEQELRYAIGDPILDMICNIGNFKVRVQYHPVTP